jgi:hypothetical protein
MNILKRLLLNEEDRKVAFSYHLVLFVKVEFNNINKFMFIIQGSKDK